jgi:hypothetical protein
MKWRDWLLISAVLAAAIGLFLVPAIPQEEAYHHFADSRAFFDIPNFFNVVSNVFFLPVGVLGMVFTVHKWSTGWTPFLKPGERWPYFVFFLSVALTTFGSAYYHWRPNDQTLLWDRLPMAMGFASLLAATIAERIRLRLGLGLLAPLIISGMATVIYWGVTQSHGHGDVRPYAFAQFGSLLTILLLLALYPPRYTHGYDLLISLGIYGVAKVFEETDRVIFSWGGIVSGHTLKHIVAAASTWWILRMLHHRVPVLQKRA